jgi:hypothetical protein
MMTKTTGWKLIYQDPNAALFARAELPAAQIPGVPVMVRAAAMDQYFP